MAPTTIYHNPRCSTSCRTLKLLQDQGIDPEVVEYLKDPPDAVTLQRLIQMLGIKPIGLIRKKEPLYKTLGLDKKQDDDPTLIQAMVDHPSLIERPVVVKDHQAILSRPPEKVLDLF